MKKMEERVTDNTVELIGFEEQIKRHIVINGSFKNGERFRFNPTDDVAVFDSNIDDDEWQNYMVDKSYEQDCDNNVYTIRVQTFEAKHLIGKIEKGSERWKHIMLKFRDKYPELT